VLLRRAYLALTNTFTLMRLLLMSDQEKDIEILALRHQLIVWQRQAGKPAFTQTDRMMLAGPLHPNGTAQPGPASCTVRPAPCWPVTSSGFAP
jgi:putative transposase